MRSRLDLLRLRSGSLSPSLRVEASSPLVESVPEISSTPLNQLSPTRLSLQSTPSVTFASRSCTQRRVKAKTSRFAVKGVKRTPWCFMMLRGRQIGRLLMTIAVISGAASAEILDILQPANLSHEMILQMEEGFNLLRNGFVKANVNGEQMTFLTKQWYNDVLARIRINAFRIELAMGRYEDLLSSAAACVEAETAVGNAVYMLPSFYNHDCDPNAHIIWLENASARLKAIRDVEADEELRICYIDASMDHNARQTLLFQGFGFKCNCLRCLSGD